MHAEHRGSKEELGDPIAIGDRIDGVVQNSVEAELPCGGCPIQAEAGARQRAGTQWGKVGASLPVTQTIDVTQQSVHMLGETMGQRDRLSVLQMGESGRQGVDMRFGLLKQGGT